MIDRGIDNNRELAQRLGVSPPTLIAKLKDPERLTLVDIRRLDRTVGLSEQAVKAMLGRA
jgi:DNA-binding Lrp family transcriptional regulator